MGHYYYRIPDLGAEFKNSLKFLLQALVAEIKQSMYDVEVHILIFIAKI